ncbi:preprotein translocase subunit YajC [Brevundimonas sp. 3P9-tot-E]|jgi:preprotein translocase subunit YajC|uniref:Sec translocon accessory complex subunit YajC n=3 Tax=Brevundimonas TaxID=41275 RepID=A0A246KNC1_BREDI|nr:MULTISPECIES: preprotein translocase subunit YajC [Brevundimonas]MDA0742246.1 preprotein translocase subunit YajC [Pseudomonadota bacterium]ASD25552.1 preprotein translocase subunit YajC [Brevundimonas diminuta]EGF94829.1 preprotein translocase, YajC subunit [Brevundimonas diminuta ATCC 11568]MCH4269573.1 preprotein translocase subunit YajC [Brevundimonas sp.]MDM8351405.1 preprotein translocase subunit YajC [Brevundimonas diminuta]
MTATQDGGLMALVIQIAPIVAIFILFYFLMIRPQQKRMKAHQALIAGVKRGDEVVLSNGMVGKVTRVEDAEAMVEISQGVNVRVVKAMIAEVRNRTAIAANDKG